MRDALSELERDGYLERVRGIGTLVNRDVVQLKTAWIRSWNSIK